MRTARAEGGCGELQHRSTRCVDHSNSVFDLKHSELSSHCACDEQEQPTGLLLRKLPSGYSRHFVSSLAAIFDDSGRGSAFRLAAMHSAIAPHRVSHYVTRYCDNTTMRLSQQTHVVRKTPSAHAVRGWPIDDAVLTGNCASTVTGLSGLQQCTRFSIAGHRRRRAA